MKDLIFKNLLLTLVSNDVGQQLQLETSQTTMHACASGHSAGLWRPVSRHRTGKLPIKAACCADVLVQVASQCNASPRSSFFPDFCRCCTPPPHKQACPTHPAPPHGTCDAPHPMTPHYLAVQQSLAYKKVGAWGTVLKIP